MGHDGFDGWGMGWGMGLFGLLTILALVLIIAALLKYLFNKHD